MRPPRERGGRDRPAEAERFVVALRGRFEHQMDPESLLWPRARWVAGGVTAGGDPVVLYRWDGAAPVLGWCWDLDELASLFDPHDPASLAELIWESQVDEPPGPGLRLDVDWADGLVDEPHEVRWLGGPPGPGTRRRTSSTTGPR